MHAPGDEPRSDSIRSACRAVAATSEASVDPGSERAAAVAARSSRRENRRWWLKLFLQPLLFLICGAALIAGLGWAQRLGYLVSHSGGSARRSRGRQRGAIHLPDDVHAAAVGAGALPGVRHGACADDLRRWEGRRAVGADRFGRAACGGDSDGVGRCAGDHADDSSDR